MWRLPLYLIRRALLCKRMGIATFETQLFASRVQGIVDVEVRQMRRQVLATLQHKDDLIKLALLLDNPT